MAHTYEVLVAEIKSAGIDTRPITVKSRRISTNDLNKIEETRKRLETCSNSDGDCYVIVVDYNGNYDEATGRYKKRRKP